MNRSKVAHRKGALMIAAAALMMLAWAGAGREAQAQPSSPLPSPQAVEADPLSAIVSWSERTLAISNTLVQKIVDFPFDVDSLVHPSTSAQSLAALRRWAGEARAEIATQRAALAALPAPPRLPDSGELDYDELDRVTRAGLAQLITDVSVIVDDIERLGIATAKAEAGAAVKLGVALLRSSQVLIRNAAASNRARKVTITADHPQASLLECYATSLDAMAVVFDAILPIQDGRRPDAAAFADSMDGFAAIATRNATRGREDVVKLRFELQMESLRGGREAAMAGAVLRAVDTYEAGFAIEDRSTAAIRALAARVRADGRIDEAAVLATMETLGNLDMERMADQTARVALMRAQPM